jgi:hypothetical protein
MATKLQRIAPAPLKRKFIWSRQRSSRASRFGKQHGTIHVDGYETPTNRPRVCVSGSCTVLYMYTINDLNQETWQTGKNNNGLHER